MTNGISNQQAGYLALGNIGGKAIQEGVNAISVQVPELMPGVSTEMVANIAAGALLTYYGVKRAKDNKIALAATAMGVSILADKGIDYIKGAMGLGVMPLRVAVPLPATPRFQTAPTTPISAVVGGERPLLL